MRRILLAVALGAALWTFSLPAPARASWMHEGGGVVQPRFVLDVATGFPRTSFLFRIPVTPRIEVSPYAEFHYPGYGGFGGWWRGWGWNVGTGLGAQMKLNLMDRGPLQVALVVEAGTDLDFLPGFDAGLRMGAAGLVSYEFTPRIGIFGGMKTPLTLMFVGFFHAYIPILFHVGGEFLLTERIHLFAEVVGGPALRAAVGAFRVGGYAGVSVGVTIHIP